MSFIRETCSASLYFVEPEDRLPIRSDRACIYIKEFKRSEEIGSVSKKVRSGPCAVRWMTSREGRFGSPLLSPKYG